MTIQFINLKEIQQLVKSLKNVSEAEKDLILKTCKEIASKQYENTHDYNMKMGFILRYYYAHPENRQKILEIMKLLET